MDYSRLSSGTLEKLSKGEALDYAALPHQDLEILSGKEPEVLDEQHPDIHFMDRALLENFYDPEHKLTYLKDHYPNLEAKLDPKDNSKVLLRSPHEFNYHVLAPSFSPLSHPLNTLKDLPGKIMDHARDIPAGAAMGAAAAAGGLYGGYPGASLASAGAGAGSEYLSQKTGEMLGGRDAVDKKDVALAGVAGAVAPFIFGAGEAVPGAIGIARNRAAPLLGEFFSGVPREALATAQRDLPGVRALEDPAQKAEFIQSLAKTVKAAVTGRAKSFGGALDEVAPNLAAQGVRIPLAKTRAPLEAYMTALEADQAAHPSPETLSKIAETQGILDRFGLHSPPAPVSTPLLDGLGLSHEDVNAALMGAEGRGLPMARPEPPVDVDPVNARKISQAMGKLANAQNAYRGAPGDTINDTTLQHVTKQAGQNLAAELSDASGGEYGKLKSDYSTTKKDFSQKGKSVLERYFGKNFEADPQKIASRLSNLSNDTRATDLAQLSAIDEKYGTKIVPAAELLQSNKYLGKPSLLPISSKGTTSTSRSLLGGMDGAPFDKLFGPFAGTARMATGFMRGPAAMKLGIRATNPIAAAARDNPEALYSILNASGALSGAGGAASGIGKTSWDKLQEYIGGQK